MRVPAYTRVEVLQTLHNVRLSVFPLGFPLILFFAIAAPNRHEDDFGASGISLPLYYMVGLVSVGAMMALISSARLSPPKRTDGWTRQLSVTPARM
jgi:ABC-2 type transport system permease protein